MIRDQCRVKTKLVTNTLISAASALFAVFLQKSPATSLRTTSAKHLHPLPQRPKHQRSQNTSSERLRPLNFDPSPPPGFASHRPKLEPRPPKRQASRNGRHEPVLNGGSRGAFFVFLKGNRGLALSVVVGTTLDLGTRKTGKGWVGGIGQVRRAGLSGVTLRSHRFHRVFFPKRHLILKEGQNSVASHRLIDTTLRALPHPSPSTKPVEVR